ncbi:MAG: class I SAM-dependent methyltransferase, partial [Pseudomonadota bacterium]
IGRTGKEWARRADALDLLLGPPAEEGLKVLGAAPGEHILDLGCGAGASTRALADAVTGSGRVLAIDVSPDLLAQARERLSGVAQVDIVEADAEQQVFNPATCDALYSRFGSMFFDNPIPALANVKSALKPGARAVFVAWREAARNQWASVPMTFSTDGAAPQGPQAGPGPFAWADPTTFVPILEQSGFTSVAYDAFEFMAEIREGDDPDPVERAANFMMRIGPMASRMKGASDQAKDEARSFLRQRLARHLQLGAVHLLASAWIITAKA